MAKTDLALSRVYQLLEPGPVVLVTTANRTRANVMTLSWHMMMEFEPPLVGCVLSARNYSFSLLSESRECAINIPTRKLAAQVVACGNTSGRRRDKFAAFGLTPMPAKCVLPPLIRECYATSSAGSSTDAWPGATTCSCSKSSRRGSTARSPCPRTIHHMGRGTFMVAGQVIHLPSRKK